MTEKFTSDSIGLCRGDGKNKGCGHMRHTNSDNFCEECWKKLKGKEEEKEV